MTGQVPGQTDVASTLVLFDIDCTLLLTNGAGRAALRFALIEIFGTTGPVEGYDFHGKTDPRIVFDLLGAAGVDADEIRSGLVELWPVYLAALERELEIRRRKGAITVLPGVAELLAALEARSGVLLGLLTGNVEAGARLKLEAAGLQNHFAVGGFGSDSPIREEIAQIAVARARSTVGSRAEGAQVVVVGDTPEDVACAHALQGRAVAVATGRHPVEELADAGADVVFEDFRNTPEVISGLLGPGGPGDPPKSIDIGGGDVDR